MKTKRAEKPASRSARSVLATVNFGKCAPNPVRQDATVNLRQLRKLTEIVNVPYGHTYS